eukprot:5405920-Karenia_brevis.AAC.1
MTRTGSTSIVWSFSATGYKHNILNKHCLMTEDPVRRLLKQHDAAMPTVACRGTTLSRPMQNRPTYKPI